LARLRLGEDTERRQNAHRLEQCLFSRAGRLCGCSDGLGTVP
jgi:hypothetical protein